jgi:cytochrome c2
MNVAMQNRWSRWFAAGAALTVAVWAMPTFAAGNVANGQALSKKWCESCHIISEEAAAGMEGQVAPSYMEFKVSNASELQAKVSAPHPFMPSFKDFTSQDYEDMMAYIATVEDKK